MFNSKRSLLTCIVCSLFLVGGTAQAGGKIEIDDTKWISIGAAARTGHHTQSHGPHPRHQSHRAQPSFHPLGLGLQLGALRCGCLRRLGVADGALVVPVAEHGEANEANESQR